MNIFQKFVNYIITLIGKVRWKPKNYVTQEELDQLRALLKANYYLILTRNNNHLSTYAIAVGNFLITGKWGFWGHVLMNLENTVTTDADFRLIEAIGSGVTYSPFNSVFAVNCVCLLKPKSMTIDQWTLIMDKANTELGKPYDTLFDLKNDNAINCVELVRSSLMTEPNYATDFANFEKDIAKAKNLTPDMFFSCSDFEIVYLVKH